MGAAEAKAWYTQQAGDPASGYVSPLDARNAIDQMYSDLGYVGKELGTEDLNNVTTAGVYYQSQNADAAAAANYPVANAGLLRVYTNNSAGMVHQVYNEYFGTSTPKQFYRNRYNGAWGSWITNYSTATPPPATGGPLTGTGFPEGVKTAAVGTEYVDTAATNGAIKWIKATGTGNTGWRVVSGDTGWRNILSALQVVDPGMTTRAGFAAPRVRRINNTLYYSIGVTVTVANADWADALGMRTTGWVPSDVTNWQISANQTGSAGVLHWANATYVKPWATGDYYVMRSFVTDHAWPTTLIGT